MINWKKSILALAMCGSLFASSCATAESASLIDFMPSSDDKLDLGGYEFVLETYWMNQFYPDRSDTTEWGERQLDRYDAIGKKYNLKIVGKYLDDYGFSSSELLTQLVVAGKDVPNLIDMHTNEVYDYYKTGMLYALDDISTIDINDEKWGPKAFRTYGIFNDKSYGFFPYEWENMPEYAGGLIYNIELANARGFDYNVHELKENGQWTWDTFENILKSMEGVDENAYPLGVRASEGEYYFAKAAIFSNGGSIVKKNGDDTYSFALGDKESVKALEWAQNLVNQGLVNLEDDTLEFTRGSAFFHACESYVATHTDEWMEGKYPASVMKDFTFINMPLGPDATENTVSAFTHSQRRLFWVPSHGSLEFDILGTIIDEIFEPLEGSTSQAWREMSKNFMYYYEDGYNEFCFGVDNCNYDYTGQLYEVKDKLHDALDKIMKGDGITENLQAIQPSIEEAIDKELNVN